MRPPYFAFYPVDFASDIHVEAMSTLQVGAYVLLLCKAWQSDPPASLPNNDQILARLARLDAGTWAEVRAGVLLPFHVGEDGRLHNKRLRQEYDAAKKRMRTATEKGRKGGHAAQRAIRAAHAEKSQAQVEQQLDHSLSTGRAIKIGDLTLPSEECGSTDPPLENPPKAKRQKKQKKPTDPDHAPAVTAFCDAWSAKYGGKYPFNRGKDADAVAFVLKAAGGLDGFRSLVARYLADVAVPFVVENRHDLGTLRLKLPRWLAESPRAPAAAVQDRDAWRKLSEDSSGGLHPDIVAKLRLREEPNDAA